MTPLESLLRAAEALRDVMMKVYDYEAGVAPVVGRFDAALARYRAEPDPITCEGGIEARLNVVDAVQEQEMDARIALQRRVLELERRQHVRDLRGKYADPQVREAEAEVVRAAEAYRDHSHAGNFTKLYGAVDALRAARAVREGQNEQGAGIGVEEPGSSPGLETPETRVQIPTTGPAPASPPAFARETPRKLVELVPCPGCGKPSFATALTGKPCYMCATTPAKPSPPPETRTDAVGAGPCFHCGRDGMRTGTLVDVCKHPPREDGTPHECLYAVECDRCGVRGPAAFKHQDPVGLWNKMAVPPAQPPKRETGMPSRDEVAMAAHAAAIHPSWLSGGETEWVDRRWNALVGWERDQWLAVADAFLGLVSEHVARVTAEAAASDSARKSSDAQCDGVRKDLATLKAECERLKKQANRIGVEAQAERGSREKAESELLEALARAEAAEKKLEEEERALTHAREEIHRLTKKVNVAEKKLEEAEKALGEWKRWEGREIELPPGSKSIIFRPSGHHEVDVHIAALPRAPAPDEAIEPRDAIYRCARAVLAMDVVGVCPPGTVARAVGIIERFWPSPAVGRGVTAEMVRDATKHQGAEKLWLKADWWCEMVADRLNAALGVARKGETTPWRIEKTSCMCNREDEGHGWALMKQKPSGAFEMLRCVACLTENTSPARR